MSSAAIHAQPGDVLQSLARLDQAVLDALPIGVYVCDADGRILRFNERAVKLWGHRPALPDNALRFCACHRVESLAGALILPDATPMALAVREGIAFENAEARVQNPDGRRWVASVTIQPLRHADGALAGAINCFNDISREFEARESLARQQKSFDLAMIASKMGTWRYTMADNICVYDENAQRLYGLTEARFLHDEEGVKAKLHPDDMETMWARVRQALAPDGDGLYDVEYRVRQPDGSWRWLSAWGYVEFEGDGETRKPVAITGASRDISDLVQADEAQKLLINELNHRVKNTLATVQSLAMQTQRSTPGHFAERFEARLKALSRGHDLLTRRQWTGIGLAELLHQAFGAYEGGGEPIRLQGPDVILSARAGLALGMVAHELATNAAKYGALSNKAGHVDVSWSLEEKGGWPWLCLSWTEHGGPAVAAPTRCGFGSRLIERSVRDELGGEASLEFAATGLVCKLGFALSENQS